MSLLDGKTLNTTMETLVIGIEREIQSVKGEGMDYGPDFATGLGHRFADDWNMYNEDGSIPEWLTWIIVAVLAKNGITQL